MKKCIAWLLVLALCLGMLSGCGSDDDTGSTGRRRERNSSKTEDTSNTEDTSGNKGNTSDTDDPSGNTGNTSNTDDPSGNTDDFNYEDWLKNGNGNSDDSKTDPSNTDPGNSDPEPEKKGSKAFSKEMRKGLMVSAEENAFNSDDQLKINELSEDKAEELFTKLNDVYVPVLDAWETDAGISGDDILPGNYHCEYDLKSTEIPEELYDSLTVVRIGDDGSVNEYACEVKDGKLIWDSSKNSVTVVTVAIWTTAIAAEIIAGMYMYDYYTEWIGAEYIQKGYEIVKLADQDSDFTFYYDRPESTKELKAMEDAIKEKAFAEAREWYNTTGQYTGIELFYSKESRINTKAAMLMKEMLDKDEAYQEALKAYKAIPADVKVTIECVKTARDYIRWHLNASALGYKADVVLASKYSNHGEQISPLLKRNYIVVRRIPASYDEFGDVVVTASDYNVVLTTCVHEMFHLYTARHYTDKSFKNIAFAEMTALWAQAESEEYFKEYNYFKEYAAGEKPAESSEELALAGRKYLALGLEGVPDDSIMERLKPAQDKGYATHAFPFFIKKRLKSKVTPWNMSVNYDEQWGRSFEKVFTTTFGINVSELETYWRLFVRENKTKFSKVGDELKYGESLTFVKEGKSVSAASTIRTADGYYKVKLPAADYSVRASDFSVINEEKTELLIIEDPERASKIPALEFVMPDGAVKTETKNGFAVSYSQTTSDGPFYILSVQGNGGKTESYYEVYPLFTPDAPKVELDAEKKGVDVTLPFALSEVKVAKDKVMDGIMITVRSGEAILQTKKIPFSDFESGKDYVANVSFNSTELPESVDVTISEYIDAGTGTKEYQGPESKAVSIRTGGKAVGWVDPITGLGITPDMNADQIEVLLYELKVDQLELVPRKMEREIDPVYSPDGNQGKYMFDIEADPVIVKLDTKTPYELKQYISYKDLGLVLWNNTVPTGYDCDLKLNDLQLVKKSLNYHNKPGQVVVIFGQESTIEYGHHYDKYDSKDSVVIEENVFTQGDNKQVQNVNKMSYRLIDGKLFLYFWNASEHYWEVTKAHIGGEGWVDPLSYKGGSNLGDFFETTKASPAKYLRVTPILWKTENDISLTEYSGYSFVIDLADGAETVYKKDKVFIDINNKNTELSLEVRFKTTLKSVEGGQIPQISVTKMTAYDTDGGVVLDYKPSGDVIYVGHSKEADEYFDSKFKKTNYRRKCLYQSHGEQDGDQTIGFYFTIDEAYIGK